MWKFEQGRVFLREENFWRDYIMQTKDIEFINLKEEKGTPTYEKKQLLIVMFLILLMKFADSEDMKETN